MPETQSSQQTKILEQARSPDYTDTRSGDDWEKPAYSDLVPYAYAAAGMDEPDDGYPGTVESSPSDVVSQIAQWTLLGDPDADTTDDLLVLPVCYGDDGGTLSEDACMSVRRMAGQVGGISDDTAESAQNVATRLLEDEFGHEFEDEGEDEEMSTSDGETQTESESTKQAGSDTDDGTSGFQYREKTAEFKAADTERQIAYGPVLISDELDVMGDFFREGTVNELAEGFMSDVANPDAEPGGPVGIEESGLGGVMHAVFPGSEHITLVENTVLDEDTVLGSGPSAQEFPAGSWVQGWKITDDALWRLVTNSTLSGFSVGLWVNEWNRYDAGELPEDVRVPDTVAEMLEADDLSIEDVPAGEITRGDVHEVSLVDSPAVPRAQILSQKSRGDGAWATKADAESLRAVHESGPSYAMAKAAGALTDSYDSCVEYLVEQRGHSQEDAAALATYLQRVVEEDGTVVPEKSNSGFFGRAKSFVGLDGSGDADPEPVTVGSPSLAEQKAATEKAGRTLSERNRRRMMVVHDLTLSVLEDADAADGRMSFAEDPTNDLDINVGAILDGAMDDQERAGPAEGGDGDGQNGSDGAGGADTKADGHSAEPTGAAASADSPCDTDTTLNMNDEDVEKRFDTIESTLTDLAETVDKVADSGDEAEKDEGDDGENAELSQEELAEQTADLVFERLEESDELGKAADDVGEAGDEPSPDDLLKGMEQLYENQQELNAALEDVVETTTAIASADGVSQQAADKSLSTTTEETEESEKTAFFGLGD